MVIGTQSVVDSSANVKTCMHVKLKKSQISRAIKLALDQVFY